MKHNSYNIVQVTGHVSRCAFTAKSEFKVTVSTVNGPYEFKKIEPNFWLYRTKPACHLSMKPRLNLLFTANGDESVIEFFSKACRSIDYLISNKQNKNKNK